MNPEDQERYEQEFEELELKVIQVQILSELQAIRMLLQGEDLESREDSTERFECTKCEWQGPKDERQAHAQETHKAPATMLGHLFTRIEK